MYLTPIQTLIMIFAIALGTFLTRSLPFILFPEGRQVPSYINYLGNVLPYAMIGLLVVYCLKDMNILEAPFGLAEGIAILSIVILHRWKSNTLISIGGGTIIYMILVQTVFS